MIFVIVGIVVLGLASASELVLPAVQDFCSVTSCPKVDDLTGNLRRFEELVSDPGFLEAQVEKIVSLSEDARGMKALKEFMDTSFNTCPQRFDSCDHQLDRVFNESVSMLQQAGDKETPVILFDASRLEAAIFKVRPPRSSLTFKL